jgi:hypothetical protein
MSDRDTPGQDDQFDGWRVTWTSRRRILPERGEIHEPVLELRKPGRMWVEVKGQAGIDRPVMLAHGMVSASLCDAHFARQWGDEGAALRYEAEAARWRQLVKIRTNAAAVGRVNNRRGLPGVMRIAPATTKGAVSNGQ